MQKPCMEEHGLQWQSELKVAIQSLTLPRRSGKHFSHDSLHHDIALKPLLNREKVRITHTHAWNITCK